MNRLSFTPEHGKTCYQQQLEHDLLQVREFEQYRWFHFNEVDIQSIVDTTQPCRIVLPVYQSMLIFLLWKKAPLDILNLGMGGGTFERFFSTLPHVNVTSVEQSQPIISMAKNYFYLPDNAHVINQSAELFLQETPLKNNFDIVLIDIYSNEAMPPAIFTKSFYADLHKRMRKEGVAVINLIIKEGQVIIDLLRIIRDYFNCCVFLEFTDYSNMILLISNIEIPAQDILFTQSKQGDNIAGVDFEKTIKTIHYLPVKQ